MYIVHIIMTYIFCLSLSTEGTYVVIKTKEKKKAREKISIRTQTYDSVKKKNLCFVFT